MNTIRMQDILPAFKSGTAIGHRNLTLVPLLEDVQQDRFQNYLLASEAIHAGALTVSEISDAGTVPELLAVNDGDTPVLLIDGEELQGAKQNRILNTSVLLPPRSKTRFPVSCVEEGRWSHISPTFQSGNYAPSSLRQRKSLDVQHSLRTRGRAESDQGAVWDSVAQHIEASEIQSPTRAMSDAMATRGDVIERYQDALLYPSGACGVVAAVCGQFVAMDAFDSPSTLKEIWCRLVASYAMDAEMARGTEGKSFTQKSVGVILEHVGEQTCEAFAAVGEGQDIRFETSNMVGQGLQVEQRLLHISVFPRSDDRQTRHNSLSHISPPSRRKRS
ncbi:MAG: hypothetical protein CMJ19_19185 [Phycisphaeraceae bacterium]|nr:hypothetical protein [Phycisphaeraceae bacterium]